MLNLFSVFRYFLLYKFTITFFYYYIANFFPNYQIFIKKFSIFYRNFPSFPSFFRSIFILHQKNFLSHYFFKKFLIIIIRHFFSFYNIFFYTQQAFVFHLLSDFCNVPDHIVTFSLFLL